MAASDLPTKKWRRHRVPTKKTTGTHVHMAPPNPSGYLHENLMHLIGEADHDIITQSVSTDI